MPRYLRKLRIDDVSSVDQGAGRGVRVMITKRDQGILRKHRDGVPTIYNKPISFGQDVSAAALTYLKREFTQAERDERAKNGHAMKDGSFPIDDKEDLHNAIQTVGRAKNPAKAKAHIKARAEALGATGELPDEWSKRLTKRAVVKYFTSEDFWKSVVAKGGVDFNQATANMELCEDAGELMSQLYACCQALDCSIQSILCDDTVADKQAAIEQSYGQFKAHLQGLGIEDDDDVTGGTKDNVEKIDMTNPALSPAVEKIINDAVAAAVAKSSGDSAARIAALEQELVVAKMAPKYKNYHDSLGSDAEKKKFSAMSDDDKDAEMEKTRKRHEDDPVYKALRGEADELRKRLSAVEDERALDIAKRDAREMGLSQADAGEVVMKMRKGDAQAIKTFEGYMVALSKAKTAVETTSKIFDEFGTTRPSASGTTANEELMAKADDLRKADPTLSKERAFEKAYLDPANRELKEREVNERMSKIHRVA